jgi:signal transduction histidine kinase
MDGDPLRLQQVFSNLLFNAIKFTPSGGAVKVLLQTGSNYHTVVVSDTGGGISSEFLPFVFDPYRQACQPPGARGGLGLGLMIARRIVERHHGSIKAESLGANKGSVFTVQLPRRQPAEIFSQAVT